MEITLSYEEVQKLLINILDIEMNFKKFFKLLCMHKKLEKYKLWNFPDIERIFFSNGNFQIKENKKYNLSFIQKVSYLNSQKVKEKKKYYHTKLNVSSLRDLILLFNWTEIKLKIREIQKEQNININILMNAVYFILSFRNQLAHRKDSPIKSILIENNFIKNWIKNEQKYKIEDSKNLLKLSIDINKSLKVLQKLIKR